MNKKKVCVGISGGVDSATAAHLLISEGYPVIGATMYLFDTQKEDGSIGPPAFIEEAKGVCHRLGIEHHVVDLRASFREKVIQPFIDGFLSGNTPNPCVICNQKIKYGLFFDAVTALGADAMATGHYVQINHNKADDTYHLMKSPTERKDQSYYLCGLSQERLKALILPLGGFKNKSDVREIASTVDQKVSGKKDSLGICFTEGKSAFEYIKTQVGDFTGTGEFVLADGTVVGHHDGFYRFTIGQKKGLPKDSNRTYTVVSIDPSSNRVLLGDEADLYEQSLLIKDLNWINEPKSFPWKGIFKICTWGYDLEGVIQSAGDSNLWRVVFEQPVRAIAKGQVCVIYDQDEILGGGTIL